MEQTINNIRLHYTTSGKGRPAVLLHGWGGSLKSLEKLASILSKGYKVYNIDVPGFGKSSSPPASGWSSIDFAKLLEDFLKMNSITDPLLIGHSNGGRIIMRHSLQFSKGSSRIVLISPAGIKNKLNPLKAMIKRLVVILRPILPNEDSKLGQILRRLTYKALRENDYLKSKNLKNTFIQLIEEDMREEVSQINKNTLLLWGRKDSYTPLWMGEILQNKIKGSILMVYDDGHGLPFRQPEVIAKEIINWDKL